VGPGANWAEALDAHLETASIILLFISADFFTSDYCYGVEMQRALEREIAGEAQVVPILVRPADWTDAPFAHLRALPTDAKPITSWRDQYTALTDVAAGIRRVIVEELSQITASAPRAVLPKIWNIPYPRNPFFLGRDDELTQLHSHLQAGQATALLQPQAISGLGGIGKTQLALEYAYRYSQDYSAVLWVGAESTDALISSYMTLATLLRLPEHEAKEREVMVQAVKTWLQTHRGWLLILDNADDLILARDFLPPSAGGHALLTTRAQALGGVAQGIMLEQMSSLEGALFLLRRSTILKPNESLDDLDVQTIKTVTNIADELGGLPLALDQAGAYIEETGCNLVQYQQRYRDHQIMYLQRRGKLASNHPESVMTTFSLSFEKLEQQNVEAAEILRCCAFLSPDAIPEEFFTRSTAYLGTTLQHMHHDIASFDEALGVLRSYSLIQRDSRVEIISIHRLVQLVIIDSLLAKARQLWQRRVLRTLSFLFPERPEYTQAECERLLPHVLYTIPWIEKTKNLCEQCRICCV
jgi:hypothetical protein